MKSIIKSILIKSCLLMLFGCTVDKKMEKKVYLSNIINHEDPNIVTIQYNPNYEITTQFPYFFSQAGCYVENGYFLIGYTSSNKDYFLLRCYDSYNDIFIWEKHILGASHVNGICFRPKDRHIYIANVYDIKGEMINTISVLDWDNLEKGIIDTITSPSRGNILSIAYDRDKDIFYSQNYKGGTEGCSNVLFSYNGVFESVEKEIYLDDFTSRYSPCHYTQGVQCIVDGVAYILYFGPNTIVAGFDVKTGEITVAKYIPDFIDNYKMVEIEGLIYNFDSETFYIIDARGVLKVNSDLKISEKIDKKNLSNANCSFVTKVPWRWNLCSCYIEDHKFVICHVAEDGLGLIMRCYDKLNSKILWTFFIDGQIYANSICFRPIDRKLYLVNANTYNMDDKLNSTILVLDYDEIKNGIIDEIEVPGDGEIFSISYDNKTDTFYGTNYVTGNKPLILTCYEGTFKKVKSTIVLADEIKYKLQKSFGVQCILDGLAYFLYYEPYKEIVTYNLNDGRIFSVMRYSEKLSNPQMIVYNHDENIMYMQTWIGMFPIENNR